MIIGFQEEEAQNHHCEGMVCEGEVIMSWNGWYQREIILCCEATAIKCRIETCCRFARHLHSNRPFVRTKTDLNTWFFT